MKKTLLSLVLLLTALMVPTTASAAWVQVADGVYQDGSTLCIGSGVTSLGSLQLNPSIIYCYAAIPPACVSNTFTGYGATLHVPTASMVSYFTAQYWYNFTNVLSDAIEPQTVTMSENEASVEIGKQLPLTATVAPSDATPRTVYWSSTNTSVATVSSSGTVTAVGIGDCYIRAICVDKQALCHITVTPERVTITLDQHEARLLPNHLMTLTATSSPATTDLAVTSNNNAVAIPRIVNGTIQVVGVAEGTATITVSTADGWCHPATCQVTVYTELGDVTCDGYINIADATSLIDYILGSDSAISSTTNADTNSDGVIGIADVTAIIDYILAGGIWPWEDPLPVTETFTVNGVTFTMVAVEGGTFTMGATAEQGSDAESNEKPAHQVTLSSYCIGQTEVTQALWQAVMGSNPSYFNGGNYGTNLQRPVEQVSWNDCQTFISQLNQMTGKTFRLPTEAEWEFAARGGNRSQGYKYAGSNTIGDVAWYYVNSYALGSSNPDYGTHAVATKAANELGLYDMSGNVWEWCQDWYSSSYYSNSPTVNPTGPTSGSHRVGRGGGWPDLAWDCRVWDRGVSFPSAAGSSLGLRLALDPDNSTKFRLSEPVVTVLVGNRKSVEILNGNGSYTTSGGDGMVTTSINGNSLTVTGVEEGTSTVYLTDTSTGATSVLTVIVQPNPNLETFTVNGVTFTMVAVEGGTFTMGATAEQGSDAVNNENPTHQVTLSSYCIGQTEVTQALWQAVMGSNPSYFNGGNYGTNLQRPVEKVSWNDCQTFISKLNHMTGKTFRLPTEAEWEFAARGGNLSQGYKYAGSNTIGDVAWYYYNSYALGSSSPDYGTHTVGTKAPNELGLYDMSGNVWEWCQDWYDSYSSNAQTNPTGPTSGSYRVSRGGSWDFSARDCRVPHRSDDTPASASSGLGLRLALDPDNSTKFRLSEPVVTVLVGNRKSVEILNGNGSYTTSGGDGMVTTFINGNSLTVTGVEFGTSTVYLTDTSTGATSVLTVIVQPNPNLETFTVGGVTFTMVEVEGGTFTMGATAEQGSDADNYENPTHQVTLSSYCIGQTEVTQALWQAVMGSNPSYFNGGNYGTNLQRPVEKVSWNDCQTFITKLNQMTGKTFRLPTEAEWEFAARGGKLSQGYKYAGSNTIGDVAWYWGNIPSQTEGNAGYGTQTVATKAPNELGLYDMSGNVLEWCQDWFDWYSSEAQTNPTGPTSGSFRVYRGGGWGGSAGLCRVSLRYFDYPSYADRILGLRLAL